MAKYELPIFAPAEVRNFPGDLMFAKTSESESAMIMPPIEKAKMIAKKGRRVALRSNSNFFNII